MVIVGGVRLPGPSGVELVSWEDDPELHRFVARRTALATEFTLHETAGAGDPVPQLRKEGLSVELVIEPSGRVRQHADLLDAVQHCGARNGRAIGVEVINPYYPSLRPRGGPWEDVIDAPWAHAIKGTKPRYVLPTRAQAEACVALIEWLTAQPTEAIRIDWHWPGRVGNDFLMRPVPGTPKPVSGIWAHHHVGGHADGAWLALYTWMRLVAGLAPGTAYKEARSRATGVRDRVRVADLLPDSADIG